MFQRSTFWTVPFMSDRGVGGWVASAPPAVVVRPVSPPLCFFSSLGKAIIWGRGPVGD
jgi:hypothetical protein